jgi:ubiquinone biosynthesis protein
MQEVTPAPTPGSARRPQPSIATAVPFRSQAALRWRFVRAYWTTFVVIGSYLALAFGHRLFGDAWHREQMAEVHRRNAGRVERAILALQGLFIKVGQLLSIMANFLPEEFRSGLERLQDQVPPRPFSEIEIRVREELGKPVDAVFEKFQRVPIASASLGQVHEAWLKDGTHVVVKVQHQGIEEITRLDLKVIRRILAIVSFFFPIQGLDAYHHQIKELIARELDFELEARNIARIAKNFTTDDMVRFPRVIPELSTKKVMTETFLPGTKVGDVDALEAKGIDRKELARRIVRTYCQMVFVDAVYHADPHPGNILVGDKGEVIFIDFGAVAEVSPNMRDGMPEFVEGVIRRDTDRLTKALRQMGFISRSADQDVSDKVIEYFHRRFQEEVKLESFNLQSIKIDPQKGFENLLDLRKMDVSIKELSGAFHIPREWVLLQRTFLLLTGVCTELDPQLNPVEVVRPYLQEFVLGNRDWTQIAVEAAKDMALQAITLPSDLRKFLNRATRGEMDVGVKGLTDGMRLLYRAVRQAIYTTLAIALGFMAAQFRLHKDMEMARYCAFGAGAMLFLLLVSIAFTRTTLKK